jgi:hypothetical protein
VWRSGSIADVVLDYRTLRRIQPQTAQAKDFFKAGWGLLKGGRICGI